MCNTTQTTKKPSSCNGDKESMGLREIQMIMKYIYTWIEIDREPQD
jgi:hypothetical protein